MFCVTSPIPVVEQSNRDWVSVYREHSPKLPAPSIEADGVPEAEKLKEMQLNTLRKLRTSTLRKRAERKVPLTKAERVAEREAERAMKKKRAAKRKRDAAKRKKQAERQKKERALIRLRDIGEKCRLVASVKTEFMNLIMDRAEIIAASGSRFLARDAMPWSRMRLSFACSLLQVVELDDGGPCMSIRQVLAKAGIKKCPEHVYFERQFKRRDTKSVFSTSKESELVPTITRGALRPPSPKLKRGVRDDAKPCDAATLSVREAGVISGFPASFQWSNPLELANAVPPGMAQGVCEIALSCVLNLDFQSIADVGKGAAAALTERLTSSLTKSGRGWLIISLFAGVGGFDMGARRACSAPGIPDPVTIAFESVDSVVHTYRKNHAGTNSFCIRADVNEVQIIMKYVSLFRRMYPERRILLLAGPPCQDFSAIGKREVTRGRACMLVVTSVLARLIQPDVFICENVRSLDWEPRKEGSHQRTAMLQAFVDVMTAWDSKKMRKAYMSAGITDESINVKHGSSRSRGGASFSPRAFNLATMIGTAASHSRHATHLTKRQRWFCIGIPCDNVAAPCRTGVCFHHSYVDSHGDVQERACAPN